MSVQFYFKSSSDTKEGDIVKRTKKIASINVGEGMLGRVLMLLANQLMEKAVNRSNI